MLLESLLKTEHGFDTLKSKGILIRYDGPYVLLKYGIESDFSDPVIRECRGIILKKVDDDYIPVCRPFDKFFNVQEPYAAEIDWNTARVQDKKDGSMVKLWFDDNKWHWSTMGVIDADYSAIDDTTFGELIRNADNYNDIDFETLDKETTYMFELVSPKNQIVIKYPKTHLYHIGSRKKTGEEYIADIGVEKPMEYKLKTLDDCIDAVQKLNNTDSVTKEGFVVVDKAWNRIKIKSPQYITYHRILNNGSPKTEDLVDVILNNKIDEFPVVREPILKIKAAMAIYEYGIERDIRAGRQYMEEYQNRGVAAQYIKTLQYPFAGFWGLDNDGNADNFINGMRHANYIRAIDTIAKTL